MFFILTPLSEKSKKSLFNLLFITFICAQAHAQLPPVFSDTYQRVAEKDERIKVYLSPQKILWQSTDEEQHIQNPEVLLQAGNGQSDLSNVKGTCLLRSSEDHTASILLDYGKELHGGLQLVTYFTTEDQKPIKVRLRFGESAMEAMAEPYTDQNATNDHALRDFTIDVPWLGKVEVGNTGFRFVRIDVLTPNADLRLREARAAFIFRDIPYLGSFKSSDQRLNKIWETGAYTVHLNMQNYLWDGIKRDRLVWVGDLHPEVMTVNTVFGYNEVVPKSLDLIRDVTPATEWMNGISSYSMWWIMIHRDWYQFHGDLAYLKEQEEYLNELLQKLMTYIDENNREKLDGNRFLDWPSSENPQAVHAGLQALLIMTLEAGQELSEILKNPEMQAACQAAVQRLRRYVPDHVGAKQAAALMTLAELLPAQQANQEVIAKNGAQNFSTFYGYYMLEAMAQAGDYAGAMEMIRTYWGGMLDKGATTFWEDFDLEMAKNSSAIDELNFEEARDIHGDFGEYCYIGYRRSLCHGWAAGPTPWLSEYVLGIQVVEPACKAIQITPHLGDLEWAEGTFPTPYGIVKVRHEKDERGEVQSSIEAPDEVRIIR
ncbi:alpha-L-rhamnosidase [Catalinimonas alkaloidigena]|uniref:alpha-L-rhamnosidase-related protein n=1 Tax=Catalinimonas alkaloidigena TaxID=1075417 RepID=UPI0024060B5E|nr:alpha-L-rhamnosidase C-terminal domain-containing protein [Catalinimonas alkaloidigena]MDF9799478.1 alpha-L-rhamnosidase [Catalinimonas alkaloidigena]